MPSDALSIEPADLGLTSFSQILPSRAKIIGEFSLAYEAYREAALIDLAPQGSYEYVLALQILDLNWAILQRKSSADFELAKSVSDDISRQLSRAMERDLEREYDAKLKVFEAAGGDEEDFEDPCDWDSVTARVEKTVIDLTSSDANARQAALTQVQAFGIKIEASLSLAYLNNTKYSRHDREVAELEKRARLLSVEYREVQKSRPIEIVAHDEP